MEVKRNSKEKVIEFYVKGKLVDKMQYEEVIGFIQVLEDLSDNM